MNFLLRLFRCRNASAPEIMECCEFCKIQGHSVSKCSSMREEIKQIEEYCSKDENKSNIIGTIKWLKIKDERVIHQCVNKIISKYPSLTNLDLSSADEKVSVLAIHYCIALNGKRIMPTASMSGTMALGMVAAINIIG
jgi:hypothetical protein